MGLQALKPSMRETKRYLCFQSQLLDSSKAEVEILSQIKRWIGELHFTKGRVHFMKELFSSGKGVISCNSKQLMDVKSAITLLENTDVFYVSGSLKKAKEKLLQKE